MVRLIILFLFLPSMAFAVLTATVDKNGRVNLSTNTSGTTFSWSKDGVSITGSTSSITDKRPQKNYKYITFPAYPTGWTSSTEISFTFTGSEIGIICDPANGLVLSITIDGTTYDTTPAMTNARQTATSQIVWGKSGLSNTSHNVTIVGSGFSYLKDVLKKYVYSDYSKSYFDTITYSVLIDGVTTESAQVRPGPDAKEAVQSFMDRIISGGLLNNYPTYVPAGDGLQWASEYIGSLAGAYYLTQDSRLPAIAKSIYDYYIANSNASTGIINGDNTILTNGRIANNFWFAFKAFHNNDHTNAHLYLDVADKIATTFKSWPRTTVGSYPDVWYVKQDGTGGTAAPGNQRSAPCFGMALLYNEPASSHYHETGTPDYMTIATHNMDFAIKDQINATTGAVTYYPGNPPWDYPERLYGAFEWHHMKYFADNFSWHPSDVDKVSGWLNTVPLTEPFFYRSDFYWFTQPSMAFIRAQSEYIKNGSSQALKDFIWLFYSAAFDTISMENVAGPDNDNDGYPDFYYEYPDYLVEGFDYSTAGATQMTSGVASIFWTVQHLYSVGNMPQSLWFPEKAVNPVSIPMTISVGTAMVGPRDETVSPSGISFLTSVGTPQVGKQDGTVDPSGIPALSNVGSPVVAWHKDEAVSSFGIPVTMSVGSPTVAWQRSDTIYPSGISIKIALGNASTGGYLMDKTGGSHILYDKAGKEVYLKDKQGNKL